MLTTLLLLLAASLQTPAEKPPELGIVAGYIAAADDVGVSEPVQVVLLSPQYASLWASEVQKRLDQYWERYKPAFAQRKEFFFEVSRMAHRDAIEYVVNRMKRDSSIRFSDFARTTGSDGKFEFKDVPAGEYRVVAIGRVGPQDVLWQESVDVTASLPQFVRLKKIIP